MPTIHLQGGSGGPRSGLLVYLPGGTLLVLGILILLMPELLRLLVAAFFIAVGALLILAAMQMRQGGMTTRWFQAFQDRYRRD